MVEFAYQVDKTAVETNTEGWQESVGLLRGGEKSVVKIKKDWKFKKTGIWQLIGFLVYVC